MSCSNCTNCTCQKSKDIEDRNALCEEKIEASKIPLTEIQATLHLNSFEYSKYLNSKAHYAHSYQDVNGDYLPYYKTSHNVVTNQEWHEAIKRYKAAEKARDKVILMTKGIVGLPLPKSKRLEVMVNDNVSAIVSEVIDFPYEEKKEK